MDAVYIRCGGTRLAFVFPVPTFADVGGVIYKQSPAVVDKYLVCGYVVVSHFEQAVLVGVGGEGVGHPHTAFHYRICVGGGVVAAVLVLDNKCHLQRVAFVVRCVVCKTLVRHLFVEERRRNFVKDPLAVEHIARRVVGELYLHILQRNDERFHLERGFQVKGCIHRDEQMHYAVAAIDGVQVLTVPALHVIGLAVYLDIFPCAYIII